MNEIKALYEKFISESKSNKAGYTISGELGDFIVSQRILPGDVVIISLGFSVMAIFLFNGFYTQFLFSLTFLVVAWSLAMMFGPIIYNIRVNTKVMVIEFVPKYYLTRLVKSKFSIDFQNFNGFSTELKISYAPKVGEMRFNRISIDVDGKEKGVFNLPANPKGRTDHTTLVVYLSLIIKKVRLERRLQKIETE